MVEKRFYQGGSFRILYFSRTGFTFSLYCFHNSGQDLSKVSKDWQSERNPNDGEEDAEQAARKDDWGDVTVANGGEDGGGEEDGLDEVPAACIVVVGSSDTNTASFG